MKESGRQMIFTRLARGSAVSIGAVRSHLRPVIHPGGPAPRAGRRGSGRGSAARWEARQIGPYARLSRRGNTILNGVMRSHFPDFLSSKLADTPVDDYGDDYG